MPPAPVAPGRPADPRPEAAPTLPASATEENLDKVVQATQDDPAQAGTPPAAEAKTMVATLSARNQQTLKQRIRTALGGAVRDLDMKFDGKGGVRVIVTLAGKSQDLDKIAITIVQSPELKDFDVSLELRLDG